MPEGEIRSEEFEAVVECYQCDYFGIMKGYTDPAKNEIIFFICPKCNAIEQVKNPT